MRLIIFISSLAFTTVYKKNTRVLDTKIASTAAGLGYLPIKKTIVKKRYHQSLFYDCDYILGETCLMNYIQREHKVNKLKKMLNERSQTLVLSFTLFRGVEE